MDWAAQSQPNYYTEEGRGWGKGLPRPTNYKLTITKQKQKEFEEEMNEWERSRLEAERKYASWAASLHPHINIK
jgi:hypothetical protein